MCRAIGRVRCGRARDVGRGRVRIVSLFFPLLFPPSFNTHTTRPSPSPHTDVDNNPSAFKNAYWEINSLAVYTADEQGRGTQVPMVAGLLQGKLQGKSKTKSKGTGGKSKKGGRGE